jgi:hypothetical protein
MRLLRWYDDKKWRRYLELLGRRGSPSIRWIDRITDLNRWELAFIFKGAIHHNRIITFCSQKISLYKHRRR